MIAVTGASGELGGRVARRLAERGVEQRLVVRDPSRAPSLPAAEVAQTRDYGDRERTRAALEGADTVYLVSASEHPDRLSLHRSAVDAAAAAGVERIVYVSLLAAAANATFTFARDHFHTEEHIRVSGLAFTFLRSSIYMDYVPLFAASGEIRGPAGSGRVAPVARDDLADSAVAVLLAAPAHEGRTYDLTGPEARTMAELADQMGVPYVEETLEEARASRARFGAPDWEVEGWVTTYAAIATGEMDVVTDAVERLAGHPPMTFREFLARYRDAMGPR